MAKASLFFAATIFKDIIVPLKIKLYFCQQQSIDVQSVTFFQKGI